MQQLPVPQRVYAVEHTVEAVRFESPQSYV